MSMGSSKCVSGLAISRFISPSSLDSGGCQSALEDPLFSWYVDEPGRGPQGSRIGLENDGDLSCIASCRWGNVHNAL